MDIQELLGKVADIQISADGLCAIDCKKGLWGVSANRSQYDRIKREAMRYAFQYYLDGEYADILNPQPTEE